MVFQSYALYPHMSVADNMSYSLRLRRSPKETIAAAVSGASAKLGLDPYLARRPKALSGGQRQRVAMGRAIVRQPKAFLFDEPLSNLDAACVNRCVRKSSACMPTLARPRFTSPMTRSRR